MPAPVEANWSRRVPAEQATVEPLYPTTRLRRGMIEEAEQLRQALLEEAEQARCEAQAAREQAEAIRREAREAGLAEGRREALEQLTPLIEALGRQLEQMGRELAGQITRIALSCAGHIVRAELRADPQRICGLVRDALERTRFCRQVTIVVNPQHRALLEEVSAASGRAIVVRADERCGLGDVRIETERGLIDASLETQLARLEEALLREARGQRG